MKQLDLRKIFDAAKAPMAVIVALGIVTNLLVYLALTSIDLSSSSVLMDFTFNPFMILVLALGLAFYPIAIWGGHHIAKRTQGSAVESGIGLVMANVINIIIGFAMSTALGLVPLYVKLYSVIPELESMANASTIIGIQINGMVFSIIIFFVLGVIGGFIGRTKAPAT